MIAAHTIRAVSQRTGLTPHVIRIWEKRYSAVQPKRTDTNRRLYSEDDVERLCLLSWLTRNGHSIGAIAQLSLDDLRSMAQTTPEATENPPSAPSEPSGAGPSVHLNAAIEAVKRLDSAELESSLQAGLVDLGSRGFLRKLMCPMAHTIGEMWRAGEITAAHEHFATAAIKVFVGQLTKTYLTSIDAPNVIVATPAGQVHELGAVIVASAASHLGWRTTYLGPSLPAAEIAGAAAQNDSKVIALSIVYPVDDPELPAELRQLRKLAPPETQIFVGGRAAAGYRETLDEIGARLIECPDELEASLVQLRDPQG